VAHTIVAAAFLLVFLVQTLLVVARRTTAHRRLGVVGVLLAGAFTAIGAFTVITETRRGFDLSGALVPRATTLEPGILLGPIIGVILFAILVAAAVLYRHRPDIHKRLMLLALVGALAPAPVAHLEGHWPALVPYAIPLAIVANVCLLGLSPFYERIAGGRMHPISLWGGVGVLLCISVFFGIVVPSATWNRFAEWIAAR